MTRVVVVGAGVVGLACAHELVSRGLDVVVLDKGEPGDACSRGNTGWISPSLCDPVPSPEVRWKALRWMADPRSPLHVSPKAALRMAPWLARFWLSCGRRRFAAGRRALARLNRDTVELYEKLAADCGGFELHRNGLLMVFRRAAALERAIDGLRRVEALGLGPVEPVAGDDLQRLEPALAAGFAGGVLLPEERHVRPEELNRALTDRLRRNGARILPGVEVTGGLREGGRLLAVRSDTGRFEADAFLVAAGAWSGNAARRLGFHLPMQAGKGYSITVESPRLRLRRPLYVTERKLVCSPFPDALRLGGTMEFSGIGDRVDPRRLEGIRASADAALPGWERGGAMVEWMGMRPLLPDGLPAIGRAPGYDNVHVASGHGMLGVTLAPATAHALAELIVSGSTPIPLEPFDPARFA